jgi:hypothetical protein
MKPGKHFNQQQKLAILESAKGHRDQESGGIGGSALHNDI